MIFDKISILLKKNVMKKLKSFIDKTAGYLKR